MQKSILACHCLWMLSFYNCCLCHPTTKHLKLCIFTLPLWLNPATDFSWSNFEFMSAFQMLGYHQVLWKWITAQVGALWRRWDDLQMSLLPVFYSGDCTEKTILFVLLPFHPLAKKKYPEIFTQHCTVPVLSDMVAAGWKKTENNKSKPHYWKRLWRVSTIHISKRQISNIFHRSKDLYG